jgi:ribosomal protein S18 acetylase RimI-like enzyme
MACTYYKRFRMEIDLDGPLPAIPPAEGEFRYLSWKRDLLDAHAEAKYRSFRWEIDSQVFPCLGDYAGCHQLMSEICGRQGFVPEATWLVTREHPYDICGTIQGIRNDQGLGSIQNVGVVPKDRCLGLGAGLVTRALHGFRRVGLWRAYLEVTAENTGAIRLYRRLGFREAKTVYKVAEIAYT